MHAQTQTHNYGLAETSTFGIIRGRNVWAETS